MSEARSSAPHGAARTAGVALVALPTLLFTGILVRELASDPSGPALNTAFHAVLILALLVAAVLLVRSARRGASSVQADPARA